ncbi:iron-siderophore ABC transporter substrate-binding protein [Ketogulonicigenium vulgare]|uniref:ABC Fe(3+) transporter n=1 Tax=Ketogulonicigenium vulgare (strain WSH-001) TaxID=759362 RepID=F9Y776_KETVW|nr:iron-siderophore ABC transporter substrate-binding protein [Ketogulonicigenium vulgare]ADO41600.1 ABC transporter substrate-binding protein [Ketogulonicigenium vulgare Y25]AEM39843.1 ABC Fe(3+) transporter [Ketogulonicigenium vulgare WSH-001]ALJ80058.1 iron ABC transporter substrate-binding protein [Ketogulonicigenium vulgare]ANW32936.1 iron ABC transporter substrate-binding protein [Ketogulonicigenium vulgare]AOZ53531.1 ABC transporter substrate-binding protein [Ketogulonicigenium vulgare]
MKSVLFGLSFASAVLIALPMNAFAQDVIHTAPRALVDMGSDAADGVFPRTVRHMLGATVLTQEPQRVAIISTGQFDSALAVGVVPTASTRGAGQAGIVDDYLLDYYPQYASQLAQVIDLGLRLDIDLEGLAQTRPDLILVNAARDTPEERAQYELLSQIAPTVVTNATGVNWKIIFLLTADALGRREQAQAYLDAFHADADAFAATLGDTPPEVSFVMSTGDRNRIWGVPSFSGSIAEDMGLARPATQRFDKTSEDISVELIDQADGDWIFYGGRGDGLRILTQAPLWPTLEGVMAGRAVEVDFDPYFFNAGPTAARIVLDQVSATIGQ